MIQQQQQISQNQLHRRNPRLISLWAPWLCDTTPAESSIGQLRAKLAWWHSLSKHDCLPTQSPKHYHNTWTLRGWGQLLMACFLHGQLWLVTEVPYRPVTTIGRSLSSLFKSGPCVAEPPVSPSPHTFFFFFPSLTALVWSPRTRRNKWLYNKSVRRYGVPRSLGLWGELANVAHREYSLPVWTGSSSRIARAQFHSSRSSNPSCVLQMDNRNPV